MKKTIGVIFPGYGEQFVTMGKDLYDESRTVQEFFEQASLCLGINFVQLCFAASDSEMSEIDKGYLAIFLLECSFYVELANRGLKPDFLAGYGIGEYAAAVASGSLSFSDGIYLLNKYSQIYKQFTQENTQCSVLKLTRGFTRQEVEDLCKEVSTESEIAYISGHNTTYGFTVAGHKNAIEKIREYCREKTIRKVKEVGVEHGLHNQLLDSVVENLKPYFHKVDFKPLKTPVITNVDAVYVTSPDALQSAVVRRVNFPVLWEEVMDGFVGCDVLISVGPGKQLAQWAQEKYPDKEIYTVEKYSDLVALESFLEEQNKSTEGDDEAVKIEFGQCHVDDEKPVEKDLTEKDRVNEKPGDYDIEED